MANVNAALRRRIAALENMKRQEEPQCLVPISGARSDPTTAHLRTGAVTRKPRETAGEFFQRVADLLGAKGAPATAWGAPGVIFLDEADVAL